MHIPYWIKDKGRERPYLNPITVKLSSQKVFNEKAKQDYFGQAPNIFVGRFGYPNINVGILSSEEYNNNDNIPLWAKEKYSISKIIDLRTNLINSSFKTQIKHSKNKWLEISQEIAMASKPTDVEINLTKKPSFSLTSHQTETPHGPNTQLKKAQLTENPKIPTKVDKIVSDIDLKAANALETLSEKGFDSHYLTKLLTAGTLGVKLQRTLVPTRWGITSVHSIIANKLVREIKDFSIGEYQSYFGGYLGNYYLILMFPDVWQYELFETIICENSPFARNYEPYGGRKKYAKETAGGFYSVKLGCLERLKNMKRQTSVLALRFIDPREYVAPLGVWVTLTATRNAVNSKPLTFSSHELLLTYVKKFIRKKFNLDFNKILKNSKLLDNLTSQKKLNNFI
jgi:DNA repair protein NreA